MKIQNWLRDSSARLKTAGISSARLDSLVLLENNLEKSREWILAHPDYLLSSEELRILNKNVVQRKHHVPLAYIIGSKEFYGRDFMVMQDVLIPRPESEAIIEMLQVIASKFEINTIIDIGTGSGCLAVTAKLLYPSIHVTAVDNSGSALTIAKKNARRYGAQIQFKQLDIYSTLPTMPKTRPYVFLANLPYVPEELITSKEILKEPAQALFSGQDGLDHYRAFWQQVGKLKNPPEYILTESLSNQHISMEQLAKAAGFVLETTKDLIQQYRSLRSTI